MRLIGLATVLALGLVLTPSATDAQQAGKVYRIGVLGVNRTPHLVEAVRQGWREHGYVEGKNLSVDWRFSEGRPDRYADFAAEFVRLKVDVMVTFENAGTRAAKDATNAIPIVMAVSALPDQAGLIASLARPGGNITGLSLDIGREIAGKMLQLLKEADPKLARVAVIHSTVGVWAEESGSLAREIYAAAQGLGLTLRSAIVRGPDDFAGAFAAIRCGARAGSPRSTRRADVRSPTSDCRARGQARNARCVSIQRVC